MARQIQLRRGTSAEHSAFTGALAELTYDVDKKTLVIHDGTTQGGFDIARADEITALIGAAPAVLDTFEEIAAALGSDPNFSTTFVNGLAEKINRSGDVMTGGLTVPTLSITGAFTLPANDGTAGQVLATDGSGNVSWSDISGGGIVGSTFNDDLTVNDLTVGRGNQGPSSSSAFGINALAAQNGAPTASANTAIGGNALSTLQTGTNNLAIGYNAGSALDGGSNNVYIGSYAGQLSDNSVIVIADGAGNIAISWDANKDATLPGDLNVSKGDVVGKTIQTRPADNTKTGVILAGQFDAKIAIPAGTYDGPNDTWNAVSGDGHQIFQWGTDLTVTRDNGDSGTLVVRNYQGSQSVNIDQGNVTATGNVTSSGYVQAALAMALPAIDTATRNGLSPQAGWMIYNSFDNEIQVYSGTQWESIAFIQ